MLNSHGVHKHFLASAALVLSIAWPGQSAFAAGAEWPAEVPLSSIDQTIGLRLDGTTQDEHVGASVDIAGDLNGDGLADLLVAAPGITGGAANAGGAYVVFGKSGGFASSPLDLNALTGVNGGRLVGDQADGGDTLNHTVRGAGDVNGDGIADFIVATPRAEPPSSSHRGSAYVVFGKANGQWSVTQSLGTLNGTNGFRFDGTGYAGSAVSGAGDFNGDGFADILIGDPMTNAGGNVYVIYGGPSFPALMTPASLTGAKGFVITAAGASDWPGSAVRNAGDLNGDGLSDIVIGAAHAGPLYWGGAAYVVYGTKAKPPALQLSALNGVNGFKVGTAGFQSYTGTDVSRAGDVNGDGYADLLVTAYGNGDKGQIFVLFGSAPGFPATIDLQNLASVPHLIITGAPGDYAGQTAGAAGDINADGFDDIAVGAPRATSGSLAMAGKSYVIFGKPAFGAAPLDVTALDGTNGFAVTGIAEDDFAGEIAGGGDVNGDGFADLLIGAPFTELGTAPPTADAGAAYVLFGRLPLGAVSRNGSAASQYISGGTEDDDLLGYDGDDVLEGRGGSDWMSGGSGTADIASYTHSPAVTASLAMPGLNTGDAAGDVYIEIEGLEGSAFNDTLIGDGNANSMIGGMGTDTLTGGGGPDTFVFRTAAETAAGPARDVITDFNAGTATTFVDRIDLRAIDAKSGMAGNQSFRFVGTAAFSHRKGELRAVLSGRNTVISGDTNGDARADFQILLKNFTTLSPPHSKGLQALNYGYIGLGNLGGHIAMSLIKAGHKVVVYDLDASLAARHVKAGATLAASPRELAAQVDHVFTCLPSPVVSEKVLLQILEGLKPGGTWIENSTNGRDEMQRLAALAEAKGVKVLEAPVTGGVHLAARGEITVLVGGDKVLFETHKPALEKIGKKIFHMGPIGSAAVIKVITNMLAFIHLVADAEALMLAKRGGLDLAQAWHAITASSGTSFVHETEGQLILNGSYDIAFTMDLALKDLGFAMAFGKEFGVPLDLASMTNQTFMKGKAVYGGGAQSTQIAKLLEDALSTDLRAKGFPARLE